MNTKPTTDELNDEALKDIAGGRNAAGPVQPTKTMVAQESTFSAAPDPSAATLAALQSKIASLRP